MIFEDIPYSTAIGHWCDNPARDRDLRAQVRMFPKVFQQRELTLTMDIYRPDTTTPLPLVLLIHGGAYYANNKQSEPIASLCRDLSAEGYVCASINYRLGFHITKSSIRKTRNNALEDAANALEHLIRHSEEYGIDTTSIFLGGASSGAIAALELASLTQLPSGTPMPHIKGIIDMWGGVSDLNMLDSCEAAILAIHGSDDRTVPYDKGYPLGGLLMGHLYGSKSLVADRLAKGHPASLVTLAGYRHAPYRNKDFSFNANYPLILHEILDFLKG